MKYEHIILCDTQPNVIFATKENDVISIEQQYLTNYSKNQHHSFFIQHYKKVLAKQ